MANYRPLNDSELDALGSDELIEQIRRAKRAGDHAQAERALSILVFRHYDDARRRALLKVPAADAEDVAMEAVASAIRSAFDGESMGEFIVWLNRIIGRRIADYHRRRAARPDERALAEENEDDERVFGTPLAVDDELGTVEVQDVIDRCLDQLSEPHRMVIELYVFDDLGAEETAERVNAELDGHPDLDTPMTTDNVHKIKSRFSKQIRGMLDDGD